MGSETFCQSGLRADGFNLEYVILGTKWEDVICPICLDIPHNCVLLLCSSLEKGCRPFVCDTDHLHSNCLDRFKAASGMPIPSSTDAQPKAADDDCGLACPLCRGVVTGWVVVDKTRLHLDERKRHCEAENCKFMGTYVELKEHAKLEHPHTRPAKIDPARQLDWENFQQSSEIIDVLSTIHSEIPGGVVLGDYVIEYGDDELGDEIGDELAVFPKGNWWTSCILYQAFDNFRHSRNRRRRRSRAADTRRGSSHQSYDTSNSDEASVTSVEFAEYRLDETADNEFAVTGGHPSGSTPRRSNKLFSSFCFSARN